MDGATESLADGINIKGGGGWHSVGSWEMLDNALATGDEDAIEVDQLHCEFVSSCEPLAKSNGRARATPC